MKKFALPKFTTAPVAYTLEEGGRWHLWDYPKTATSVVLPDGQRWDDHNGWNEELMTLDEVDHIKRNASL